MQILTARTIGRDGTTRTRTFTLARPTVERDIAVTVDGARLSRILVRRLGIGSFPTLVLSADVPARMPDHVKEAASDA